MEVGSEQETDTNYCFASLSAVFFLFHMPRMSSWWEANSSRIFYLFCLVVYIYSTVPSP